MARNRRKVSKRNVALKIETYNRLEKYKVELVQEREDPNVTFDDAINSLLDERAHKEVLGR